MTTANWDAEYESLLVTLRGISGVPEDVAFDFVRWVPVNEWATVQIDCLSEAGFEAEFNNGGLAFDDVPEEQGPALNTAHAQCQAKYPMDARAQMVLPTNRAKAQYAFFTGDLLACVEARGFSISTPPSEQTWIDQYYTTRSPWNPYEEAISQTVDIEDQNKLWSECAP